MSSCQQRGLGSEERPWAHTEPEQSCPACCQWQVERVKRAADSLLRLPSTGSAQLASAGEHKQSLEACLHAGLCPHPAHAPAQPRCLITGNAASCMSIACSSWQHQLQPSALSAAQLRPTAAWYAQACLWKETSPSGSYWTQLLYRSKRLGGCTSARPGLMEAGDEGGGQPEPPQAVPTQVSTWHAAPLTCTQACL